MGKLANPKRGQAMTKIVAAIKEMEKEGFAWVTIGKERVKIVPESPGYIEFLVSARHGYFLAELYDKDAGVMLPTNTSIVNGGPISGQWKKINGLKIHAAVEEKHLRS